jgi:glycosyltransferase involved in cell wall biosynthesis
VHVVVATHWMPWDKTGGTEVHCHELATALAALPDVQVSVVAYTTNAPPADLPYSFVDLSTRWLRFLDKEQGRGRGNALAHWLHERALNRRMVRLARHLGADVLHRQAATPFRVRAPMPVVITLHRSNIPADDAVPSGFLHRLAYPLGALLRAIRSRGIRRSLDRADAVIAVSDHAVRNVVRRLGVARTANVIANGCAPPRSVPAKAAARKRLAVPAKARVVLFLGRVHPEKRPERLLALLDEPDLVLAFGGAGPLVEPLRARSATEPRLRVPGFLSEAEKADWLAAADVVALPSGVFETQPIVLLEALRVGTPVWGTYSEWLPAPLRRFGRFGDDVRGALEAARLDARPAAALVPTWDDAAWATLAVYRLAVCQAS